MTPLTLPVRNLRARPTRTLLTVLGAAVAVASFIALAGLSQGAQRSVEGGMEEAGGDLIVAERSSFTLAGGSVPEQVGPGLAVEGVASVAAELLNVSMIDRSANAVVAGWADDSFLWDNLRLVAGRRANPQERAVVVLGEALSSALGKTVGAEVEFRDRHYRIVGIARFDNVLNQSTAIVPLADLQHALGRPNSVTLFQVKLVHPIEAGRLDAVRARLQRVAPGLAVLDGSEFAQNIRMIGLIGAIASTISLVVLGTALLAIMNTLLMAVSERTAEIGILAAIGWSNRRIASMLVAEALILSVLGALLGLGLGHLIMEFASRAPIAAGYLRPYLTIAIAAEAAVAAVLIGLLGAVYPIWRALKMSPAEAMRRI
ncbi:MAG: ABC transporter permease [Alphaproteobacteria bacterium]|nr:ABC transporter permease [Alphaproteobacteria bacterium]